MFEKKNNVINVDNQILNVIREVSGLERYGIYLDEVDGKWHIDIGASLEGFNSKKEAEVRVDEMIKLAIITKVANVLELDYGYDGKIMTITINKEKKR